jgi:hypothetical protein
LGGVPLRGLTVRQGADKFELGFSEPNPEPMKLLEVSSGAGIELENLANANFSERCASAAGQLATASTSAARSRGTHE